MTEQFYSIQMASKLSGVGVHAIRAWEKRYGAVKPKRSDTGRRVFTEADVDRLWHLSQLTQLGNSIKDISPLSTEELKAYLSKFSNTEMTRQTSYEDNYQAVDVGDTVKNLIMALQMYRLDIISHELTKLSVNLSPKVFAFEVIMPLLEEVGLLVASERLSVAQEHALSSILKFHIGGMVFQHYKKKSKPGPIVALTTPEGELHEFGIMIASLLCSQYNKNFVYLGPNMPAVSLAEATRAIDAKYIVLGTSPTLTDIHGKEYLNQYLENLLTNIKSDQFVCAGGVAAFDHERFFRNKNFRYFPSLEQLDEFISRI